MDSDRLRRLELTQEERRGLVRLTIEQAAGRPARMSALTPTSPDEIERAEAECQELANSPAPRDANCEMARARLAARKRLGMEP